MPKYFFRTTNGKMSTTDLEGVELSDTSAVEPEAREMAHGLLTASLVARPEWTDGELKCMTKTARKY